MSLKRQSHAQKLPEQSVDKRFSTSLRLLTLYKIQVRRTRVQSTPFNNLLFLVLSLPDRTTSFIYKITLDFYC